MNKYFILGLCYSCGSIKPSKIPKFELITKKKEFADFVNMQLNLVLGNSKKYFKNGFYIVECKNSYFSIDKDKLPNLDTSERRRYFLAGYFEGKSSVSVKYKIIKLSGKYELLEQIKKLLELEGVNSKIYKNQKYFSLYIEGKTRCKLFKEKIDYISDKKKKLDRIVW
ncbi:MAG: hypothetical protein B6U88_00805 [Candidatus Aenigmarchaeota archaeon ex4484_56]|nr:MAG: hypothetical protein B6U88_00805 [Candidatus Aenigmarchaeota archaeon ex4484_56]